MNLDTHRPWTWWFRYVAAIVLPVVVCFCTLAVGEAFPQTVLTVAWELLVYASAAIAMCAAWRLLGRRVKARTVQVLGLVPILGLIWLFAVLSNATPKCEYTKPKYIGPQLERALITASCEK